jgi:hypothetical protein
VLRETWHWLQCSASSGASPPCPLLLRFLSGSSAAVLERLEELWARPEGVAAGEGTEGVARPEGVAAGEVRLLAGGGGRTWGASSSTISCIVSGAGAGVDIHLLPVTVTEGRGGEHGLVECRRRGAGLGSLLHRGRITCQPTMHNSSRVASASEAVELEAGAREPMEGVAPSPVQGAT